MHIFKIWRSSAIGWHTLTVSGRLQPGVPTDSAQQNASPAASRRLGCGVRAGTGAEDELQCQGYQQHSSRSSKDHRLDHREPGSPGALHVTCQLVRGEHGVHPLALFLFIK